MSRIAGKMIRCNTARTTHAHMRFLFDHYKPETEINVRENSVRKDEKLELLKEKFRECLGWLDDTGEIYNKLLKELKGINITSQNVMNFSLALAEFQDENYFEDSAGLFLSAMIELSEENDFTVITKHLGKRIELLGYKNRKNIVVEGNVGDWVGKFMQGGEIIVKGDAGNSIGLEMQDGKIRVEGNARILVGEWMRGGEITVKGDAGDWVGNFMQGGEITVEGDAGDWLGHCMQDGKIKVEGNAGGWVGDNMQGGEITIEGEFGRISDEIIGGKIYHREKLIYPKFWKRFRIQMRRIFRRD